MYSRSPGGGWYSRSPGGSLYGRSPPHRSVTLRERPALSEEAELQLALALSLSLSTSAGEAQPHVGSSPRAGLPPRPPRPPARRRSDEVELTYEALVELEARCPREACAAADTPPTSPRLTRPLAHRT